MDEVDKAKAFVGGTILLLCKSGGSDFSILLKEIAELLVSHIGTDVLDVDVREVGLHLIKFALTILLRNVVPDKDLLLVQQHTIHVLDSIGGSLSGLVVHESVSPRVSKLILSHLARQDVSESREGVVKSLVVDLSVQVLDEDVSLTGFAKSRVALRPHDAARAALDECVVEFLQCALTIRRVVVVHVGVSERSASDSIAADSNRGDLPDSGEKLEEHGLGDRGIELSNVEGSRVRLVRGCTGCGRCRSLTLIVGWANIRVDRGAIGG